MSQGKTEKQAIRLTTDVAATQRAVEQARHTLGERRFEGLDTTAATEALSQAEGQLREDQEALVVAQQKDAEAQRALMDSTRQASDAAADAALTAFKASVLELEAPLFGEMKRAIGDAGSLAESGWAWRRIKSPKGGAPAPVPSGFCRTHSRCKDP